MFIVDWQRVVLGPPILLLRKNDERRHSHLLAASRLRSSTPRQDRDWHRVTERPDPGGPESMLT